MHMKICGRGCVRGGERPTSQALTYEEEDAIEYEVEGDALPSSREVELELRGVAAVDDGAVLGRIECLIDGGHRVTHATRS